MESLVLSLVGLPVLLAVLAESFSASRRQRETTVRLARIERRIQLVMDNLGIAEPEPSMPEVVRHLDNGRKIEAIKAYRQATGESLRDAKNAVERLAALRGL